MKWVNQDLSSDEYYESYASSSSIISICSERKVFNLYSLSLLSSPLCFGKSLLSSSPICFWTTFTLSSSICLWTGLGDVLPVTGVCFPNGFAATILFSITFFRLFRLATGVSFAIGYCCTTSTIFLLADSCY